MPESLSDALADLSSDTVVTGLSFLVAGALKGSPEQLYEYDRPDGSPGVSQSLYKALAASKESKIHAAKHSFSHKFGKDFSARRFIALIREARSALEAVLPTQKFIVSSTGEPRSCLANAIIQLQQSGLKVRYDEFSAKVVHQSPSPWGTIGPWVDKDDSEAADFMQHKGLIIKSDVAHEAATVIAQRDPYHQVRDYLTGLLWDGKPRLESLFSHYFGCDDGKLTRDISKAWMISCVARIIRRGCQAKYLPVIEGPQDQGKSRAIRGLVNGHFEGDGGVQWYRDRLPKLDHKDLGQYMQGVWMIEVAELSTFSGKAWEDVKSFISSQTDNFRTPYGRNMMDYPRQVIFIGTTNEERWGGDRTGLVRFWPLRAGKMNFDAIIRDRDQLWAEARFYFDEGHVWYLDHESTALAREEQALRQPEEQYQEMILTSVQALYLDGHDWVTTGMVMDKMQISIEKRDKLNYRVAHILRNNGWEAKQHRPTWSKDKPVSGYRKKD